MSLVCWDRSQRRLPSEHIQCRHDGWLHVLCRECKTCRNSCLPSNHLLPCCCAGGNAPWKHSSQVGDRELVAVANTYVKRRFAFPVGDNSCSRVRDSTCRPPGATSAAAAEYPKARQSGDVGQNPGNRPRDRAVRGAHNPEKRDSGNHREWGSGIGENEASLVSRISINPEPRLPGKSITQRGARVFGLEASKSRAGGRFSARARLASESRGSRENAEKARKKPPFRGWQNVGFRS